MNPFEQFLNKPQPNKEEQLNEPEVSEKQQLLQTAIAKAEMLLYAPLSTEVRTEIDSILSAPISDGELSELRTLLSRNNSSPESCASTIIQRRLRGIENNFSEEVLSSKDKNMLALAIEGLAADERSQEGFGDAVKDWINGK